MNNYPTLLLECENLAQWKFPGIYTGNVGKTPINGLYKT